LRERARRNGKLPCVSRCHSMGLDATIRESKSHPRSMRGLAAGHQF
jgi:hypothetical protein